MTPDPSDAEQICSQLCKAAVNGDRVMVKFHIQEDGNDSIFSIKSVNGKTDPEAIERVTPIINDFIDGKVTADDILTPKSGMTLSDLKWMDSQQGVPNAPVTCIERATWQLYPQDKQGIYALRHDPAHGVLGQALFFTEIKEDSTKYEIYHNGEPVAIFSKLTTTIKGMEYYDQPDDYADQFKDEGGL